MIWKLIMTTLSCVLFFGFVAYSVKRFGLLSCYSAYGPKYAELSPIAGLNIWSIVTFVTALMLIPVMLVNADENPWQFVAFLCPVLILFVAMTPDYNKNKLAGSVHLISAIASAVFSILYICFVTPPLWWIIVVVVALATIASLITGFKKYWDFWFEMAAYVGIYTTVFIII